jgi:hypothetical protein
MLCQSCWKEEARVHFTVAGRHQAHNHAYCLACAREVDLSWLLVWGYSTQRPGSHLHFAQGGHAPTEDVAPGHALVPEALPVVPRPSRRGGPALVATAVARCACGCYVVAGAELPCNHGTPALLRTQSQLVEHLCHCGRTVAIPVPVVFCPTCQTPQTRIILASAETCLWDEERRRVVALDHDLRGGRVTWDTFAIRN